MTLKDRLMEAAKEGGTWYEYDTEEGMLAVAREVLNVIEEESHTQCPVEMRDGGAYPLEGTSWMLIPADWWQNFKKELGVET